MQRGPAEQETTQSSISAAGSQHLVETTQDGNSQPYFEGLMKLRSLAANLNGLPPEKRVLSQNLREHSAPEPAKSEKLILLEKSRNKALIEHDSHEIKAEAFQILASRYRALGLEAKAHLYDEGAQMERAATRGFQSVIDSYDKKLEDSGFRQHMPEDRTRIDSVQTELGSAERHLEEYKSSYSRCGELTLRVLESQRILQILENGLTKRSLTTAEKEQFEDAANQRDKFMRLAEKEALKAAESYKNFRAEIQSVEKYCDVLNRAPSSNESHLEKPDLKNSRADSNGPTQSERRMKKLAVGMAVCQTLKIMDREL